MNTTKFAIWTCILFAKYHIFHLQKGANWQSSKAQTRVKSIPLSVIVLPITRDSGKVCYWRTGKVKDKEAKWIAAISAHLKWPHIYLILMVYPQVFCRPPLQGKETEEREREREREINDTLMGSSSFWHVNRTIPPIHFLLRELTKRFRPASLTRLTAQIITIKFFEKRQFLILRLSDSRCFRPVDSCSSQTSVAKFVNSQFWTLL